MTSPVPLTTTFPPRMKSKPPTSGGFLGFSKELRTVEEDNSLESKSTLLLGREKIKPAPGNYRQFFKSQMTQENVKAEIKINENDSVKNKYPEDTGDVQFEHFGRNRVSPGLAASFSNALPVSKVRANDTQKVETQTQYILMKEKFETLTDYQLWIQSQVDPLMMVSRLDTIFLLFTVI